MADPLGVFSSSLLLSSLELSDTKVYEPYTRTRLGTASHFCEVVVLKLRTVPIDAGGDWDGSRRRHREMADPPRVLAEPSTLNP